MASRRVITYEQVVRRAERLFHRTGGLDMAALAAAASVSRATLYRVAGSRDRVLGDVLWAQGSRLLAQVLAQAAAQAPAGPRAPAPDGGVERLLAVTERFNRELVGYPPLRTFLREEPDTACRVLFLPEARVHARFVARWRELLEQAQAGGAPLALPLQDAAYVMVRIGESVLYRHLLDRDVPGDAEPDVELVTRMQRAVLRG